MLVAAMLCLQALANQQRPLPYRVQISRNEHGDLVIHPIPAERGQALLQAMQALGEVDEQENSQPMQETLRRLDQLAQQIHVMYPEGPTICKHYAEQFVQLKDAGTPIRANDLWIACHALAENATLVTHNTKEFLRVRGLVVEDWVVE
jgi:predicted nucleic acid-binding protein